MTALNTKRSTYAGKRVGVLPGTYNCLSLVGGSYRGDFATPAFNIAGGMSGHQQSFNRRLHAGRFSTRAPIRRTTPMDSRSSEHLVRPLAPDT
jgi:hypothetical protein